MTNTSDRERYAQEYARYTEYTEAMRTGDERLTVKVIRDLLENAGVQQGGWITDYQTGVTVGDMTDYVAAQV